ncbi:MAG: glutamate racemase [Pelomonas sp.]|nr:glutamate racemase [Roseateles sp.]MBV8604378.1 glutamate racemase [Roseateles sp.]
MFEIGVFDSGVGGLTVLRELRRQLPQAPLLYVADTAYAPYGEKPPAQIVARSLRVAAHLREAGAALLVVACNTATAHAIEALRARWPDWPIVGVEPGVKPAVLASRNGRVGVLATPATLRSARYRALLERHAGGATIVGQPCPGLVDLIERGDLHAPALVALVETVCAPLRAAGVDTVLMGCTHYPLVQDLLQAALGPEVRLLNIEGAVAQQVQRLWKPAPAETTGSLRLQTTGDPAALTRFVRQALGWTEVEAAALALP